MGRLGNHLWQYAVCRTVAEFHNYKFHIPRNFLGTMLFDCSLGVEENNTSKIFLESSSAQFYEPYIFDLEDFTKLHGFFQCEKYIAHNKKNIEFWFSQKKINVNYLNELKVFDEDVCLIHFRGGDYNDLLPEIFLDMSFWQFSMAKMKIVSPSMKFSVITDDLDLASKFFPNLPIYCTSIVDDFTALRNAKYLIISNSTFAWWASWLNTRKQLTIAPKYWMGYNKNNGWWLPADSITNSFSYMGKDGRLMNSAECAIEFNNMHPDRSLFPF